MLTNKQECDNPSDWTNIAYKKKNNQFNCRCFDMHAISKYMKDYYKG